MSFFGLENWRDRLLISAWQTIARQRGEETIFSPHDRHNVTIAWYVATFYPRSDGDYVQVIFYSSSREAYQMNRSRLDEPSWNGRVSEPMRMDESRGLESMRHNDWLDLIERHPLAKRY